MLKKSFVGLALAILLPLAIGCGRGNIVGGLHQEGKSNDVEVLVADGQAALDRGDYEEAREYFGKAKNLDANNWKARYGHAVAYMQTSEVSMVKLLTTVTKQSATGRQGISRKSPAKTGNNGDFIEELLDKLDVLKDVVEVIIVDLSPIGQALLNEEITREEAEARIGATLGDIELNLTVCHFLYGILIVLDSDDNDHVGTGGDVFEINRETLWVEYRSESGGPGKVKEVADEGLGEIDRAVDYLELAVKDTLLTDHDIKDIRDLLDEARDSIDHDVWTEAAIQEVVDYINGL
ncbi:MAG: hypothetical protein QME81_05770 [bacterium]|nr:hypothetical protein [bacterium]